MLRFVCNLPATALAAGLARLAGSRPRMGDDLFICCTGVPRWLNGPRGGMTVGNVFLTSSVPPMTLVSAEPPKLKYRERRARTNRAVVESVIDFQI